VKALVLAVVSAGVRVTVLTTGLRAVCTLGLVCLLSRAGLAQSVLNFPVRDLTRIAITNTTPYAADVKFTLYNADGSQATAARFSQSNRGKATRKPHCESNPRILN
jgi:hypothetical protein